MKSGYKTITPIQFANALSVLERGAVNHESLRVYLACFAMVAVREAAARHTAKRRRASNIMPRYQINELRRLTGLGEPKIKRALKKLRCAELMTFTENQIEIAKASLPGSEELLKALSCGRSPKRPIPVPRSLLRFLAQNRKLALAKTALAYAVRGLALSRSGEISGRGSVKLSWIAGTFDLSERAVNYARAELIQLGWIDRDRGSVQRKLNRTGAYFSISLDWSFAAPNVQRDKSESKFAPLPAEKCVVFAPPYKNKKTSIESKYQKAQGAEAPRSGVYLKREAKRLPAATLDNIQHEDFHQFGRIEELYFQAVDRGLISGSESSALNFLAAGVRAREVGHDPARVFVTLVRRRLWHHITQAQEDQARAALLRYRTENPDRFRVSLMRNVSTRFAA